MKTFFYKNISQVLLPVLFLIITITFIQCGKSNKNINKECTTSDCSSITITQQLIAQKLATNIGCPQGKMENTEESCICILEDTEDTAVEECVTCSREDEVFIEGECKVVCNPNDPPDENCVDPASFTDTTIDTDDPDDADDPE